MLSPVVKVRGTRTHCIPPPPIFSLYASTTWSKRCAFFNS